MSAANRSQFAYVTIIRTTPEKLWEALTDPKLIRQYWYGVNVECAWQRGAPWKMAFPDGSLADAGDIDGAVKLTITHELDRPDSKLITAVSAGWPYTLSNLKSLLETGESATKSHPGH